MGVNDPNGLYRFIGSDLMKLFMQTLKMSSGDKTPPSLDKQMEIRLEGRNAQTVFVFFLEIVWSLQQFFSWIFGLYAIARVVMVHEKITQ